MSDIIRTGGVLLPDEKIDLYKWAVIACDQFTADPSYWQTLAHLVGDAPSTLKLVYPECFLSDIDEARISSVNAEMHRYLHDGLFRETAAVRTVRSTVYGRRRTGFVFKIDLDAYSFDADSRRPCGPPRVRSPNAFRRACVSAAGRRWNCRTSCCCMRTATLSWKKRRRRGTDCTIRISICAAGT